MKKRSLTTLVVIAALALLAAGSVFDPAQGDDQRPDRDRKPRQGVDRQPDRDAEQTRRQRGRDRASNRDLLDRGAPTGFPGATFKTHTTPSIMTATLANLAGTPGVTIGAIMTFAPPAPAGVFHGYFFAPSAALTMISPGGMFPTSYQPFFVTGAYVWGGPPVLAGPIIGAGVAPGLGGMVGAFSAVPVTFGPFSPGMIFGGKTLFPHSPPAVSVPIGSGVACGFDPGVAGAVLGGLTPGTGGGKPVVAFAPGATVTPIAAPPATYVAGCFIAGALVPVELQSFEIE